MISVENLHPKFAKRCYELNEGESAYSEKAEIPYDLHCYADGWYVFWKCPPNGQLGRHLSTWQEVLVFLHGDWNVGKVIPSRKLKRLAANVSAKPAANRKVK